MFKVNLNKFMLRNKIITIIIITFGAIGLLTQFLIYPSIQNPLIDKEEFDSESSLKAISSKIINSYKKNNYFVDKYINSKDSKILLIRILNSKSAYIIADSVETSNLEGRNILKSTSILGSYLNKKIIKAKSNKIYSLLLNVNSSKFLVSYFKFTSYDYYNDKILIVNIKNVDHIYSYVDRIFLKMLTVFVVYSAFIILLIILFLDYILSPLKIIQTGIGELRQGNLGYKISIHSNDELEDIGALFNNMSTQLYNDDIKKKDFIQNASHELKTPIAGIKTMTQLLQMTCPQTDIAKDFLNDIVNEVDRMNNIITDLLLIAEVQNTNILNKESIDTTTLFNDSFSHIKHILKAKNTTIESNIEQFNVSLDILKFERVLINIIGNALKYSDDNPKIIVNCTLKNSTMIIKISDNGIGIPEENLPFIFQRFYRVDKAHSRKTGGTGLGLSIAKDIVEAHNGKITVESALGKGTTFELFIPIE